MRPGRAAAALSAAGVVLVAGCAGGKLAGGTYQPPIVQSTPAPIPANAKKISLSFSIPQAAEAYGEDTPQDATRRAPQRRVKYISPATFGGSVVLKIFQNGSPAFPDQTFTVGGYGAGFNCTSAGPPTYGLYCYNTVNVYAPPGSDTFFVETFDSANALLSVTPGLYGSSFYGSPPAPYTVPYAGTIAIPTYAYARAVQVIASTPCVTFSAYGASGPNINFVDADANLIMNGPLANPVTLTVGGGFGLYRNQSVYPYTPINVGSPYTIYDATYLYQYFVAASHAGATGTIAANTPTGSISPNFGTLFARDHMALTATSGGLYALGLAYGGPPPSFNCGRVPLKIYNSFPTTPVTFSNPVAIAEDDLNQVVAVVDNTAGHPTVDVIALNGIQSSPGIYVPASQVVLSSATGPLEVAVSQAQKKIYVLNSDGSVQTVDYSNLTTNAFLYGASFFGTAASGLTTPSGSGIDVYSGAYDSVLIGSAGGPTLYEIDNANTLSPSAPIAISVSGRSAWANNYGYFGLSSATTASAVSADNQNGIVMFRLYDPNGPSGYTPSFIEPCVVSPGPCYSSLGTAWGAGGTLTVLPQTMAISGGINGQQLFVSTGGCVELTGESAPGATFNFFCGLAITRIVSARDGSGSASTRWLGGLQGSTFYFTLDGVSRLPFSGTNATIRSGGFF